jgi:hypothetical protein
MNYHGIRSCLQRAASFAYKVLYVKIYKEKRKGKQEASFYYSSSLAKTTLWPFLSTRWQLISKRGESKKA